MEGRLSGRWAVWGGGRRLSDVSPRSLAPLDSQWRIRIEFGVALVAEGSGAVTGEVGQQGSLLEWLQCKGSPGDEPTYHCGPKA